MGLKYTHYSRWDKFQKNYWAIPKCGSTSIKHTLLLASKRKELNLKYNPEGTRRHSHGWVHTSLNCDYVTRREAITSSYKNFTVVRNPYQRFISGYKDILRRGSDYFGLKSKSMSDVIEEIQHTEDHLRDCHFRTQMDFIGVDGRIIVDDVLFLEDIGSISKYLSLPISHVNSINRDVKLPSDVIEKINQIYAADFRELNYEIL